MSAIPKTMRAVVYRGVNHLRVETVPVPRIQSDELLVKVAACGVCPTDIKKIQYGTLPPPRIFGHETAGTISQVGARLRDVHPNDNPPGQKYAEEFEQIATRSDGKVLFFRGFDIPLSHLL